MKSPATFLLAFTEVRKTVENAAANGFGSNFSEAGVLPIGGHLVIVFSSL